MCARFVFLLEQRLQMPDGFRRENSIRTDIANISRDILEDDHFAPLLDSMNNKAALEWQKVPWPITHSATAPPILKNGNIMQEQPPSVKPIGYEFLPHDTVRYRPITAPTRLHYQ